MLVVDDQPAVLDMIAELLAADGAAGDACASADEALATLRAAPPDMLISDIAMPGRDGYWLIERVRRLPPQAGGAVPAIALTAYVQLEDRLRVLAAGYQQYVPKPVDSAELRDVIPLPMGPVGQAERPARRFDRVTLKASVTVETPLSAGSRGRRGPTLKLPLEVQPTFTFRS